MADAAIHGHEHEDNRSFFQRWFMSTNHKDIGILYLFTAAAVGFISVASPSSCASSSWNRVFNTCVWKASWPTPVHPTATCGT